MQAFFEILSQEWAIRALISSSLVGITCGVLGCFIVLRNMSMIGDALSHAILPGVVVAFVLIGYNTFGFFLGAVAAGLLSALAMTWIQQNAKTKNDAAIGIVFTAMFSIGVMGISYLANNQGAHLDLKDFLFGQIMGVSNQDLYITAATSLYVILSIIVFYRYLFASTFQPVLAQTMGISVSAIHYYLMLLLSFAVVASLQTVGVILVVAMLITPASTALLLSDHLKKVLVISAFVGLLSAITGLVLAIIYDTTPGPAMTVVATLFYLMTVIFAPQKGVLVRYFNKLKLEAKIKKEDTLKQALKLQERGQLSLHNLSERLGYTAPVFQAQVNKLLKNGLLFKQEKELLLSEKGLAEANQLVRAHRLWETYLVQKIGLTEEQIHEDAEKYEHLLTAELLKEVDRSLGYPTQDPHGSPIPPE